MPKELINSENLERKSFNVNLIDGKLVVSYNYEKGKYNDENYESINYQKVFDDWESFQEYSEEFLKITK